MHGNRNCEIKNLNGSFYTFLEYAYSNSEIKVRVKIIKIIEHGINIVTPPKNI